jgi:hypothetical protein
MNREEQQLDRSAFHVPTFPHRRACNKFALVRRATATSEGLPPEMGHERRRLR